MCEANVCRDDWCEVKAGSPDGLSRLVPNGGIVGGVVGVPETTFRPAVERCHRVLAALLSVGFVAGAIDAIARNETPRDRELGTICLRVAGFALFSIPLFVRAAGKRMSFFVRRHDLGEFFDAIFWVLYAAVARNFQMASKTSAGWMVSTIALALAAGGLALAYIPALRRVFDDVRNR
jgi:hypothetical protein